LKGYEWDLDRILMAFHLDIHLFAVKILVRKCGKAAEKKENSQK
jgi:hypothetical protein